MSQKQPNETLSMDRNSIRLTAAIKLATVLVFFILFLISLLQRPVYNSDFWWHLATGKYIVENNALPQSDPFTFTSHEEPTQRKSVILKGYWLAQVIFYEVYKAWNLKGIIILRSLLMSLFLFFIFLTIKKQGSSDLLALLLTTGVFLFARTSMGERPQLLNFVFFSASLYLLEDFRITGTKKILLIPFMVLMLSNMHPGFIVCLLLVSLYLIGYGILFFFRKDSGSAGDLKRLFLVWALTLVFSLFNPNNLSVFGVVFSLGEYKEGIVEHMSPFFIYAKKIQAFHYSYLVFLILSLFALRYWRQIGVHRMLILGIFTLMSISAIRYVVFYMCVAAPILAALLMSMKAEKALRERLRLVRAKESFLYFILLAIGAGLIFREIPSLARYEFKADTVYAAPAEAADFLTTLRPSGNMFNEYGIGGYLIWRLYPEKKVFTDGRNLEPDVYNEYGIIGSAGYGRNQSWEDLLRKHNISYVVMPPLKPGGGIYPLVEKLFDADDWALIYSDHLSLIFMKKTADNNSILKEYEKNKTEGLNTIIAQAAGRAMTNKASPHHLITLGKTFYKTGRFDDAERAFELASQRDPGNPAIREWLRTVKGNRR